MEIIIYRAQHPVGLAFALTCAAPDCDQLFMPITFSQFPATLAHLHGLDQTIDTIVVEHFTPDWPMVEALCQLARHVSLYPDSPLPERDAPDPINLSITYSPTTGRDTEPTSARRWDHTRGGKYPPRWLCDLSGFSSPLWPVAWALSTAAPVDSMNLLDVVNQLTAMDVNPPTIVTHYGTMIWAMIQDQLRNPEYVVAGGVSGVAVNVPAHLVRTVLGHPLLRRYDLVVAWTCLRGQASGHMRVSRNRAAVVAELTEEYRFRLRSGPHMELSNSFFVSMSSLGRLLKDSYNVTMGKSEQPRLIESAN
jgi:hypothetical protein